MKLRAIVLCVVLGCLAARPALATPDAMGPLTVTSWDAGMVSLAGANIHVVVYYPTGATGPFPVVGVVHGAGRNGTYQRVLAQTLASYGLVSVVPDMPCTPIACDHNANAMQLLAMLDWAVTQSAGTTAPIAGLIDPTRRGLTGHSWGALAAHLAAARDSTLRSVVLLDPNDDTGVGAAAAPMVHVPELQLLAQLRATCNNQWIATTITPTLAGPALQVTLPTSAHCDPEDPTDGLCPLLCGSGSRSTTPFFRRYAVAWTVCNLIGDPAMAEWIGGSGFDADVAAGHLAGAVSSGLAGLACRTAMATDGGTNVDSGAVDAAADSGADDAITVTDSGTPTDAPMVDASLRDVARADGSVADTGTSSSSGSCRCTVAGRARTNGRSTWCYAGLAMIAFGVLRRRRASVTTHRS